LLTFTLYLHTMITAGVPLLAGLKQIAEQTENLYMKKVINSLCEDIQAGKKISEAMERFPKVFNELYVSVIRAGEASGKLEVILQDLYNFLEWQDELVKSIRKAMVYPTVVLGAVGSLVIILIVFVFPRFMGMFADIKMELPAPTKLVIFISNFISQYWKVMLGTLAILVVAYIVAYRTPQGKVWIDKYKLRLPIFGPLIKKVSISRFAHYLGVMLRAGINVTEAFAITERLVGNADIANVVRMMREMITGGKKISEAMERFHEFPPLVIQMVSVGEMSGKLEDNLNKVSMFYDREVPEAIQKTLSSVQPLIIIFLAGVVILVALSIFLPMFQMASAIKQM